MMNPAVFILAGDAAFQVEDNVYHAPRAFVAHSVLKYYINLANEGEVSFIEFSRLLTIINQHLREEIDLYWDGDIVNVTSNIKHKKRDDDEKEKIK